MPYPSVDLTRIKTYPLGRRENRVALEDLIFPDTPYSVFDNPELAEVAERVAKARTAGRPVIMMFGGHIIKRGLAPVVIDLLKKGVITHLASNGAATIHDFEIALLGHTSEDVEKSLADGSFGMAEETGGLMNAAIRLGAADGLGLGESLGRLISEDPRFTFRENSILYIAHSLGIPYTVHVAIGTDIIHQHPSVDFAASGWTTGQDFKIFAQTVCGLEGGVFLNFGSAVIGPEVFLKALSIARNLGNPVRVFTTANFDIIPMKEYRLPVGDDNPEYYYRPRKNVVNRPVMLGGRGYHITGDHIQTLPNLYHLIMAQFTPLPPVNQNNTGTITNTHSDFARRAPAAAAVLDETLKTTPELSSIREDLMLAYMVIERCFQTGGTLFLAGNEGSMADALHISGELDNVYKKHRRIPTQHQERLLKFYGGEELAKKLQARLRNVVLGNNPVLANAVDNNFDRQHLGFAQELYALARSGDVLLGFSVSGYARNLQYAVSVAHLLGLTSIVLTGMMGDKLAGQAEIVIKAPSQETTVIQTWHGGLYYCLREMLEAQMFSYEGEL